MAWTDNDAKDAHGRVHVAVEGAAEAADVPAPAVRVTVPKRRVLGRTARLMLPVTCSAACDVRVHVEGSLDASATLSLARAGRGELELRSALAPIAPLRPGPVKILLRYGAPGARHATARTFTPTLSRRPGPRVPRVDGLSARRDGGRVSVRWHTRTAAHPDRFFVFGFDADGQPIAFGEVDGAQRTRFETEIADPKRAVRRVSVAAIGLFVGGMRTTSARVRE